MGRAYSAHGDFLSVEDRCQLREKRFIGSENQIMPEKNLFSFEFISLCTISFLALCNVAAFYNFHLYLQHIGILGKEAGFIIGIYSLTAMILLFASRHLRLKRSFSLMLAGIFIVAASGVAYLFADRFWLLVIVRIANGAGMFLIMGSCMVLLIAMIPSNKTGLAFSLYSVALLSPYSIMPAVSEMVLPLTGSPTKIYFATTALLLPAIGFLPIIRGRMVLQIHPPDRKRRNPFIGELRGKTSFASR